VEQSALPGDDSGALKNALDWLRLLGDRDPPYLHDKVIGLISTAGGTQGLRHRIAAGADESLAHRHYVGLPASAK
jgi:NADPH-dependent FMN reductase